MAGYDINVGKDLLPGLLSGQNGLAKLVEAVLNQILAAQIAKSPWGFHVDKLGKPGPLPRCLFAKQQTATRRLSAAVEKTNKL